jgi:hypothetical protein
MKIWQKTINIKGYLEQKNGKIFRKHKEINK